MDFKVGDIVYTISHWGQHIVRGEITEVIAGGYRVDWDEGGHSGLRTEDAFRTKDEALADRNKRNEIKRQEYRDEIKTKEDALRFIYDHCGNFDEYTDNEANDVGKELALKYFSIKL